MKNFICAAMLLCITSVLLSAQDFNTLTQSIDIDFVNGSVYRADDTQLISGRASEYIPFMVVPREPSLELRTAGGEFVDSMSYPQFEDLRLLNLREDGRVLGIATDTVEGRSFFVTVATLDDLRLNRFLSPSREFSVEGIYHTEVKDDALIIDAEIGIDQTSERVYLHYNSSTLLLDRMEVLPRRGGHYYRLEDNFMLHVMNDPFDAVLVTRYDEAYNIIWQKTYRDVNLESVYSSPDNRIYLAGREFLNNGRTNAIIAEIDQEGNRIHNNNVTEDPDLWNFKIMFSKILPYQDRLIAVGSNNYNSDSWSTAHNFMIVVYDKDLNEITRTGGSQSGANSNVIQSAIRGNTIYGVVQAHPFESSYSYQFVVDISEDNTATESLAESSLSIFPNPTSDKIRLDNLDVEIMHIDILDGQGRLCYSSEVKETIDVAHLAPGHYLLRLTTSTDIRSWKFSKQ